MANFNAQYAEIAANFVDHFYKVFQTDRSQLYTVYHPEHSMLSFEGSAHQGREAIHAKYTSLPFGTVNVVVTKIDPQPTVDGGILIMVIGQLKVDQDQPHAFSQIFHLKSMAEGAFVVVNDMFRLNVHNFG